MARWNNPHRHNRTDPAKGAYNGFALADRGDSSRWGYALKVFPSYPPPDSPCAVCGEVGGQIGWHNEDYRAPIDAFAVCSWCHWAIHSRLKPRQEHVWPQWLDMLELGFRPPRCPKGTRWATWAARYLRKPSTDWDWVGGDLLNTYGPRRSPLADLLPLEYVDHVPAALAIADGAPHLPGQWNTIEAVGSLVVFEDFTPPLPF